MNNSDYRVHTLDCQCRKCLLKQVESTPAAVPTLAEFLRNFVSGNVVARKEIQRRIEARTAEIDAARPALAKYLHGLVEFHVRQAAQDGVDDGEMLVRMILNAFVVGQVAENVRLEVRGTDSGSLPRVPR